MKTNHHWLLALILMFCLVTPAFSQISESAMRQIVSLNQEKESRTPVQKKIDSQLLLAQKQDLGETITPLVKKLDVNIQKDARGLVAVDIRVNSVTKLVLQTIIKVGGVIVYQSPDEKTITAKLHLKSIELVATLTEVLFIYPAGRPMTHKAPDAGNDKRSFQAPFKPEVSSALFEKSGLPNADQFRNKFSDFLQSNNSKYRFFTGSVTSEGDLTHKAAAARNFFDVNGSGVTVGVLSDGVTNLAASQASGNLGPVTILPGQQGTGDEGTAMLEIIHDLAPGAKLVFATAFGSQASFAQNILALRAAGCDIIVDDVYYSEEAVFQDDNVAQAVNAVTASGALYFSAAGNSGNKDDNTSGVWEGDFNDAGTGVIGAGTLSGGTVHNFGGGVTNNLVTAPSNGPVSLFWSDPLGRSSNDYDLFVLNNALTSVVGYSNNIQDGNDNPIEIAFSGAVASNRIVMFRKTGQAVRALHLNTNRGALTINTVGQTRAHASAAAAYCVAATPAAVANYRPQSPVGPFPNPHNNSNTSELFTSDGPRRMFYNADTTTITPGNVLFGSNGGTVRLKPDITAADGVTVTGAGGFPSPFFGTSASAPHAAAIAALLKSGAPSATPAQIRTALVSTAIDIEAPGYDRNTGAGIIMAYESLQSLGVVPQSLLQAGTATLTSQSCTPGNGAIDPGETVTVNFCIQNIAGASSTANLVGTLLNTGGVNYASQPQNYGVMQVGGAPVCRSFSFTASGTCGSTVTASIQLQDGTKNLGIVSYAFTLGALTLNPVVAFSNNTPINISIDQPAAASPYPSNIIVSGIANTVTKVTVRLNNAGHTWPDDIAMILVSPTGRKVMLMSRAGGDIEVSNLNLVFDDFASLKIPDSGPIPSNTTISYKPTDYSGGLPAPAPQRPYDSVLSVLNGLNPNGTWSLYVADEGAGDGGSIAGGWTLNFTTGTYNCCVIPPLTFSGKIMLQGAYNSATGAMNNTLNTAGLLQSKASVQPYNLAEFSYPGTESVAANFFSTHTDIVDWVLLELRSATSPSTLVGRRAAFVKQNGTLVDLDGTTTAIAFSGVPRASYFVVVRHRNHLGIRSASAINFTTGAGSHDFTTAASQCFQNQIYTSTVQVGTTLWAMRGGDANSNKNVKYNGPDNDQNEILNSKLSGLLSMVINNVYARQDLNLDGTIKWSGAGNDQNVLLNIVLLGLLGLVYNEQL